MAEVVMCGICLNMDVKMHKLRGYQLEDYYTWIVGNVLETDISHYFQYACYECTYHIKKYNSFREKCLRSQSLLIEMHQKKGKLTEIDVKSVDRQKFNLSSNLTYGFKNIHTVESTSVKQDCNVKTPENDSFKDIKEIKIEIEEIHIEEKDEIITSQLNVNDENFFTIPTDKKEAPKKLKTEKACEENFNKPHKKQRKKASEENSTEDTERKLQMRNRRQDSKNNSQILTALEDSLANHVKIITFTLEEQLQQLMKRKESLNYINSKYKCEICYKGFIDPDAFNNHMKRHDPVNGSNICPICKMCFLTKTAFSHHRSQHAKNYVCKTCSRVCLTTTHAKLHVKEHEGKTYECEQCDHVTIKLSSLLTHIRLKHPSDFVCDICGFSFVSELGLRHHKSRHKLKSESVKSGATRMGYCKVCNLRCNSHQIWKKHINSLPHKIKMNNGFNCDECNETFKNSEDFRLHRSTQHPTAHFYRKGYTKQKSNNTVPKVWPSKCPHCDKMIQTIRKYYFHLKICHPDKPYPLTKNHICDVCGKRFGNNACLQYHKREHLEGKTFKCTECSKSFFSNSTLQLHKTSHSDARPHSCHVCHKAFKTKGNLLKHLMIHTGEKPYPCKYCGKAFLESSGCRVHIMTVHLKQPAPYVSQKRRRTPKEASQSP